MARLNNKSMDQSEAFWKRKSLGEMSKEEWESLCDGCARCCLVKLEDEDNGHVFYTRVVCKYLNEQKCECRRYDRRTELVPDCVRLTPDNTKEFHWLPGTCAYRLISEGKDLEWWHPLVSGSRESVDEAGISVKDKVLSEEYVHPASYDEHIIKWVEY